LVAEQSVSFSGEMLSLNRNILLTKSAISQQISTSLRNSFYSRAVAGCRRQYGSSTLLITVRRVTKENASINLPKNTMKKIKMTIFDLRINKIADEKVADDQNPA
jgi:hypothetical protein